MDPSPQNPSPWPNRALKVLFLLGFLVLIGAWGYWSFYDPEAPAPPGPVAVAPKRNPLIPRQVDPLAPVDPSLLPDHGEDPPARPAPGPRKLRGMVRDEAGEGVPGVDVRVFAANATPPSPCPGSEDLFQEGCDAAKELVAELLDAGKLEPAPVAAVKTGLDGSFEVEVGQGLYDLLAEAPGGLAGVASDVESEEVELTLLAPLELRGTVQEVGAGPVGGAEVVVITPRPNRVLRLKAAGDGTFSARLPGHAMAPAFFVRAPSYLPYLGNQLAEDPVLVELFRPVRLTGRVLEKGKPAPHAQVELVDFGRKVITDDQGRFSFEKAGCSPCFLTAENERGKGEATVTPEGNQAEVDIILVATGALQVTVRDEDSGDVLAEATVEVLGDAVVEVETQGDGLYLARRVPRGSYTVSAIAPGYLRKEQQYKATGEGQAELEVLLKQGLTLTGRVEDEQGQPVANVVVVAQGQGANGSMDSADSDAQGNFVLRGLEPGEFTLTAEHGDYVATEVKEKVPQKQPRVLVLRRAGTVKVLVVTATGEPIAGAEVTLAGGKLVPHQTTSVTDDQGEAVVEQLNPGLYSARAWASGYTTSAPVPVEASVSDPQVARVVLTRGGSISGVVVDDRGEPVAQASVYCASRTPRRGTTQAQSAESDARGRFVVTGLEEGEHALTAESNGAVGGEPTTARAGASDVKVVVRRMGTVVGRVTEAGRPLPRFTVQDELVQSASGQFRHPLPPGPQTIVIAGDFVPQSVKVTVEPGKEVDVGEVAVHRGGSIEGMALKDQAGVAGLAVDVRATGTARGAGDDFDVSSGATDWTQPDGRFRFEHLPPGRYRVSAHGPEGVVLPQEVVVAAGQPTKVVLKVEGGSRIFGVVRNASGEPVFRSRVSVVSDEVALTAVTDRSGNYTVDGLPPGRYRVYALASARPGSEVREVALGLGREMQLDLTATASEQALGPDDEPDEGELEP